MNNIDKILIHVTQQKKGGMALFNETDLRNIAQQKVHRDRRLHEGHTYDFIARSLLSQSYKMFSDGK